MNLKLHGLVLVLIIFELVNCEVKNLRKRMSKTEVYKITKTWDNDTLPPDEVVTVKLGSSKEKNQTPELVLSVEAKFYDDPHIPDDTPKETMAQLWNYEVVELFLLGNDEHYLEIEVSPKGQYILLELKGQRKLIRDKLPIPKGNYIASINPTTNRWTGRIVIPNNYLPQNITKFNAYAIHGSNENRVYKALFPTKKGEFADPDFHRLSHFGPIDFQSILSYSNKQE